jgi:hypothetical protein
MKSGSECAACRPRKEASAANVAVCPLCRGARDGAVSVSLAGLTAFPDARFRRNVRLLGAIQAGHDVTGHRMSRACQSARRTFATDSFRLINHYNLYILNILGKNGDSHENSQYTRRYWSACSASRLHNEYRYGNSRAVGNSVSATTELCGDMVGPDQPRRLDTVKHSCERDTHLHFPRGAGTHQFRAGDERSAGPARTRGDDYTYSCGGRHAGIQIFPAGADHPGHVASQLT